MRLDLIWTSISICEIPSDGVPLDQYRNHQVLVVSGN